MIRTLHETGRGIVSGHERKGKAMKKSVLLLASMAVTVLLASGVALAATSIGGPGDDTIYGTHNPDRIDGRAGDDTIYGLGGDDGGFAFTRSYLVGGEGDDTIYGGPGHDDIFGGRNYFFGDEEIGESGKDTLYGGGGVDRVIGDAGADDIYGNRGHDLLIDGPLTEGDLDILYGGSGGDDLISRNRPPSKDIVYCGSEHDLVDPDSADVLYDCEALDR
jgi:Ca2+-binding RTX toxin-like protein